MTFNATNAPATFKSMMDVIFHKYLNKIVIVFIDGILIYSKDGKQHEEHLRIVLHILRKHKFYARFSNAISIRN